MTAEELSKKVTGLAKAVSSQNERFQIVACKLVEGRIKKRVFNNGIATDGSKIGKYQSAQYKKVREKRGAQTGYVDLMISGDLLMKNFQVGKAGKDIVLGFASEKSGNIARYQEEYRGKDIFTPSQSEKDEAHRAVMAEIRTVVSEEISKWL